MCLACEMDALWYAAMERRARALTDEAPPQATPPPLPEGGRVGEGVASGVHGPRGESADPHPNPPPEEGGGGMAERGGSKAPRFSCKETPAG
jgi:hypothetical protein